MCAIPNTITNEIVLARHTHRNSFFSFPDRTGLTTEDHLNSTRVSLQPDHHRTEDHQLTMISDRFWKVSKCTFNIPELRLLHPGQIKTSHGILQFCVIFTIANACWLSSTSGVPRFHFCRFILSSRGPK